MTTPALTGYWQTKADMTYGVRKAIGPTWAVMVAGDSRASAWPFSEMGGGAPCYEGGLPGATIRDALTYLPTPLRNFGPRICILQLGINNIWIPLTDPQWAAMQSDYEQLIIAIKAFCPFIIVTTPIPPEKGTWRPDSDVILRAGWVRNISAAVCAAATNQGATVVDLYSEFVSADLTANPGTTWDGVHLTPAAYALMKVKLDPVVKHLLSS